jgi:hypothetical protein
MLVEHTFVTTLEAPDTLMRAAELLIPFGFVAAPQRGFDMAGIRTSLEMSRGSAQRRRPKDVREWPHSVRIEWDRGRVEVAVSLTPPARGGFDSRRDKSSKRETAAAEQLLLGIAQSLESALVGEQSPADAQAAFAAIDNRIATDAAEFKRKQNRQTVITLTILGVCVVAAVVLIIVFAR